FWSRPMASASIRSTASRTLTSSAGSPPQAGRCRSEDFRGYGAHHGSLILEPGSLYRGFPFPVSREDDDCRTHRRNAAISSRGFRTSAPDGAFGLFGNRYFPARTDFERLRRLRQAAL